MAALIALAFIAVPIIEIAIFIEVGGAIGLWNTLAVVVVTAIVGTWMLRAQGMRTLRRAQESLARQEFPVSEVFDGLCLLVGGVLLLTPGFFTDAIGFILFLPPARAVLKAILWRRLSATGTISADIEDDPSRGAGPGGGPTIEGDFHRIPPDRRGDGNSDKGSS